MTPADGDKTILNGISGRVEPGQMLGILGPSGAHSLLDARCLFRMGSV